MYGMLLESIQHYLKEIYGEEVWNTIRALAGVENRVFITHHRYSDDLFIKLANGAAEVVGKEKGLKKKDFMKFFGNCFVKFFSNYGYDQIVRVTGRTLGDFLNSIDNIHEHMRFGYPKMESPSFYCEEETSTGLTLNYLSKRKGFKYYVIGQIEQVVREFFPMEIKITIIGQQQTSINLHVIYRLEFDNQSSKPFIPKALSTSSKTIPKCISLENFFNVFPFSFVISQDMKLSMAGSYILTTLGDDVIGSNVCDVFALRRPKMEFSWDNVSNIRHLIKLMRAFFPEVFVSTTSQMSQHHDTLAKKKQ
jgi:guanylate cyclase